MAVHLHTFDLPSDVTFGDAVAVDTETLGLNLARDRLCVVQLSDGDGDAHVVHFPSPEFDAPVLKALLTAPDTVKIFHYARFDLAILERNLGVMTTPVFCTKIASRLVRTYTDRHGLKDLTRELLGIDLSKAQQSSDWGAPQLTPAQVDYAASDVLHLHKIKAALEDMLDRENRRAMADQCFSFLPTRARLDLAGWGQDDIFAHS